MKTLISKIFITTFLVLIFISCRSDRHREGKRDRFYTEKGEWDAARIPFIQPYEAVLSNEKMGWCMNLTGSEGETGFNNIKKANIINNIIIIYCTNSLLRGVEVKESWRILVPSKQVEKGFDDYQAYLDCLKSYGITSEPRLVDIGTIAKYFSDHDTINWQAINK